MRLHYRQSDGLKHTGRVDGMGGPRLLLEHEFVVLSPSSCSLSSRPFGLAR